MTSAVVRETPGTIKPAGTVVSPNLRADQRGGVADDRHVQVPVVVAIAPLYGTSPKRGDSGGNLGENTSAVIAAQL